VHAEQRPHEGSARGEALPLGGLPAHVACDGTVFDPLTGKETGNWIPATGGDSTLCVQLFNQTVCMDCVPGHHDAGFD
jgi:hypothetical protein